MRCRNCHTVMMDTDAICPGCRSSVESATAAPPEQSSDPGMLRLLPMFGGALGGLLFVALTSPPGPAPRRTAGGTSGRTLRWIVGIPLILVGFLFLTVAMSQYSTVRNIAEREATVATAADLRRPGYADSAPAWISYTFTESKPAGGSVKRRRLGGGGDVTAECLLVRVEDRWLVATVAEGFEGNELIGRVIPVDTPSAQSLIERVRGQESKASKVLDFEINAVDGCASEQQVRYAAMGWLGAFGLIGFLLGLYLVWGGRR